MSEILYPFGNRFLGLERGREITRERERERAKNTNKKRKYIYSNNLMSFIHI